VKHHVSLFERRVSFLSASRDVSDAFVSFAIYQLRTAYLAHIQDGVGERLINVNTAFLNDPAFRAAGWHADSAEVKRTYSPPIPAAITSEYFQAPPPSAGGAETGEDEDGEHGMVTGTGNQDAAGHAVTRRRRRREQLEEDDSSDLSDETDEESEVRPLGQVKFKVPARIRSGSSPIRSVTDRGLAQDLESSPMKVDPGRARGSSLSVVEVAKTRTRRDTTTSSEMEADSDLDPALFQRRVLKSRPGKAYGTLSKQIEEDEEDLSVTAQTDTTTNENAVDSDADSLVSDFSETLGPDSLLAGSLQPSSLRTSLKASAPDDAPRKRKQSSNTFTALPPSRPISMVVPVSALTMALRARDKKPTDPFERFASLSGAGDPSPLYLKIYPPTAPHSDLGKPMEILIRKTSTEGEPVTVAEAIGFSLWKYGDEARQPAITRSAMNVNKWTFRVVEDEEIDDDFPPLLRTKPMSDFTSNNRARAGGRGRARDKPWDEFALVEASESQFRQNESETPSYSLEAADTEHEHAANDALPPQPIVPDDLAAATARAMLRRGNPITDPYYVNAAFRKESVIRPADEPAATSPDSSPTAGAPRTLTIHYTSNELTPHVMTINTTVDTYLAEIFDQACRKFNLDKALYMFKLRHTATVVPTDRVVEALGIGQSDLDLVRRRFIGEGGTGTFGSPSSTSPNAPILGSPAAVLHTSGPQTPKKFKNRDHATGSVHPLAQQHSAGHGLDPFSNLGLGLSLGGAGTFKRYNVIRKQPMSLAPSHPRVLELSGDYLHILPADPITTNRALYDPVQNKTTSVHFSSVVGCKLNRRHPNTFRLIIYREKESKRYDFEVGSAMEAQEIVDVINAGMALVAREKMVLG